MMYSDFKKAVDPIFDAAVLNLEKEFSEDDINFLDSDKKDFIRKEFYSRILLAEEEVEDISDVYSTIDKYVFNDSQEKVIEAFVSFTILFLKSKSTVTFSITMDNIRVTDNGGVSA